MYQIPTNKIIPTTPTETPMMMPKVDVDDEDESRASSDDEENEVGGGNVGKGGVHDQGSGFEGVDGGGR